MAAVPVLANISFRADLPEFDITEYLDSEEAIAAYLTSVIEENDPSELAHTLGW